jgi:hypothetical protein
MKSREVRQTEALERATRRWDHFKSEYKDEDGKTHSWRDRWTAQGGKEAYLNGFRPARFKVEVVVPPKAKVTK